MKNLIRLMGFWLSLLISAGTLAQTEIAAEKMSVSDRMAKARAARAEKQTTKMATKASPYDARVGNSRQQEKATPADYKSPVDKSRRGPNGEAIHTGARGARYYINKNGNKTYLSSNQ